MTSDIKKRLKQMIAASGAMKAEKVFLFRTGDEVSMPFVVLTDFRAEFGRTKDGVLPPDVTFVALCVAATSKEACDISNAIAEALDGVAVADYDEVRLLSIVEAFDFEQGAFVNTMEFLIN